MSSINRLSISNFRPMCRLVALMLATVAAAALLGQSARAGEFEVDAAHSRVGFSVKHMMISSVQGRFKDFEGKFNFDPAKNEVKNATFTVKTASIDTDNAKRDDHLRGADFFEADKFPTITLTNSKLKKSGKDKYKWTGDLNLHGVTKPVTFDLEYKGSVKGMQGETRAGFSATGKINRKDYGLKWNKALETGGVAVGDDVTISIDVEGVEAKPETAEPAKK